MGVETEIEKIKKWEAGVVDHLHGQRIRIETVLEGVTVDLKSSRKSEDIRGGGGEGKEKWTVGWQVTDQKKDK